MNGKLLSVNALHELVVALGLDGKPIKAITIEARVKCATKVIVEMYAFVSETDEVCKIIKQYTLQSVNEDSEPADHPTVEMIQSWRDNKPLL